MVDDTTGDPVGDGLAICKWCHDATPRPRSAPARSPRRTCSAPTTARPASGPPAPGARTSAATAKPTGNYDEGPRRRGHADGVPAANKQCTVCHDARYTTSGAAGAEHAGQDALRQANDSADRSGCGARSTASRRSPTTPTTPAPPATRSRPAASTAPRTRRLPRTATPLRTATSRSSSRSRPPSSPAAAANATKPTARTGTASAQLPATST